jgi:L-alanine-DL-glutamate epimerase-like enolase superfamily enzyme
MTFARTSTSLPIQRIEVSAYTIPTDSPESDGTLEWDKTTIVIVRAGSGDKTGIGYTYADEAVAALIHSKLAKSVQGRDAMSPAGAWQAMVHDIRNLGRPGICSMAIAAVDSALWDLKARLLNLPLVTLLGQVRESIPIYGSGGFTSYSDKQLQDQFRGWVEKNGARKVKMKIGRDAARDPERVRAARKAIGHDVELYVDANGAYERKQAAEMAWRLHNDFNVKWFEEPVSSDDLEGLHLMRDQGPPGMAIAAGEYGYDQVYFRRMLEAQAVDVLQADATRCAGITGFLKVAALCEAFNMPLSAHTAPTLHAHPMCALGRARDVEYFHDHVRIERMLFDGAIESRNGELRPDLSRPGIGIELKRADAEKFAA